MVATDVEKTKYTRLRSDKIVTFQILLTFGSPAMRFTKWQWSTVDQTEINGLGSAACIQIDRLKLPPAESQKMIIDHALLLIHMSEDNLERLRSRSGTIKLLKIHC